MKNFLLALSILLFFCNKNYAQDLEITREDIRREIYSTTLFISSFSPLAMQGYVVYAGSDTVAANSTKTILLGSSTTISFPIVCELGDVNTPVTIRVKSILSDRFIVANADATDVKGFIWWVFTRRP